MNITQKLSFGGSGQLLVVSGPSGVGKGTLLEAVRAQSPLPLCVNASATTRSPRPGEIDGVHYKFLSRDDFAQRREAGEFLECFEVYAGGDWYGTLRCDVEELRARGAWVVLEIDVQGGLSVKEAIPDAVTIFITPPSIDALATRLTNRGTESQESLKRRLAHASNEMSQSTNYDYTIVNDNLETATAQMLELLKNLVNTTGGTLP